ncbi:hypothetical protein AKJ41_05325 [candidate division MSBL1 archaeon SCGC-AAA259O05]|uniref:Uncharacterized protein n=1 Tax=candidate division MSBL1 archaeon SCGC-AAA259O05 TaxID=1698271 RepID=A0A133UZ97_9EURY|nr:hypothetical protein AKJ41_05325 [candidate division MSBL1 archaeon SCGC-AAA259O05]
MEERVAKILDVEEKESTELLNVTRENLKLYHSYLSKELSFPFDADVEDKYHEVRITNLSEFDDLPEPIFYGLLCEGRRERRKVVVPLGDVTVKRDGRNKQLVKDYRDWLWNYRYR